jgi:hypothetical protein
MPGALLPRLIGLAHDALSGQRPDLVLLATTKADLPHWCASQRTTSAGIDGGPAWLAEQLGIALGAPAFAISAACASSPLAIGVAGRWLLAGRAQRVLVLGGDAGGDFVRDGFTALRALDPHGCRPFDAERLGLSLGEAAVAILLSTDDRGEPGSYLQGWGASMDANHLTGPSRDGAGMARACTRALARAQAGAPAVIIAHGTGTRFNDDSESLAYASACPGTPITAFKGLLGHSLGACGLLEIACAQEFLRRGTIAGVVGLQRQGCAGAVTVLTPGPHRLAPGVLLSANAGFGGLNGAVVIGDHPAQKLGVVRSRRVAVAELRPEGWVRQRGEQAEEGAAWADASGAQMLPRLSAREVTGEGDASWGRMDLACRALVALGHLLAPLPEACAVVLCTRAGCAATDRQFERDRLSGHTDPQRFAYTLPSTPIGELSIRLKVRGPGLVLMGASDVHAGQVADDLLRECPAVLLAWIEADQAPHRARAELWLSD